MRTNLLKPKQHEQHKSIRIDFFLFLHLMFIHVLVSVAIELIFLPLALVFWI